MFTKNIVFARKLGQLYRACGLFRLCRDRKRNGTISQLKATDFSSSVTYGWIESTQLRIGRSPRCPYSLPLD
jgi:hypothetical protein